MDSLANALKYDGIHFGDVVNMEQFISVNLATQVVSKVSVAIPSFAPLAG